jgi:ribosomal protein L11
MLLVAELRGSIIHYYDDRKYQLQLGFAPASQHLRYTVRIGTRSAQQQQFPASHLQ